MVEESPKSLWHNREFMRLWIAQIVSNAGSQVTALALPLTAVYVLRATSVQMSIMDMAGYVPHILFGLFAGVWVDRTRRRKLLVGADLGRALFLGTIPVAAALGILTFVQLYIVAFLVGTLTMIFTIASISILPALVNGKQLVEANSKLSMSDSVISIAGPGAAGGLVQFLAAPKAIVVDAISYVVSALSLRGVGVSEQVARRSEASLWAEIGEGVRELVRTPVLRALAISISVGTFGVAVQRPVTLLFFKNDLGFNPATIGLVYALGGGGSLMGAALASRASRWLGTGRSITAGSLLWALGALIVPVAGLSGASIVIVGTGQIISELGATVWGVNQMSLRQRVTPVGLFGRVTAARRLLMFTMQMSGAALGGVLGTTIGLRATLVIGGCGLLLGFLVTYVSPVHNVRET